MWPILYVTLDSDSGVKRGHCASGKPTAFITEQLGICCNNDFFLKDLGSSFDWMVSVHQHSDVTVCKSQM